MSYYVQMFYIYFLPPAMLISLIYIAYFRAIRKSDIDFIEKKITAAIEESLEFSEELTRKNFNKVEYEQEQIFDNITNRALENIKIYEEKMQNLRLNIENVILLQKEIYDLNSIINKQADEIKKRDAIIERKTKQIKRLKNEI
jgi:hypothetical protein